MNSDEQPKFRITDPESAEALTRQLAREQITRRRQHESDLDEADLPSGRIGSVPYLNAVPLTRGIEDRVIFVPPSQLAAMLREQKLDAALVSVTEVLFNDCYDVLDGIAVASLGEVKSVLLAHRGSIEQMSRVFCDPASLTSVSLLKVLLAERGLKAEFVTLSDYKEAPQLDAVLLIGDQAIDFARAPHDHQILDLGAAWTELTKLPFVYAVWALRRAADTTNIRRVLREAKAFGLETLDYIISERSEYDYAFRKDYLGWHIHYHLGVDEKRGLAKFAELLRKHGFGPIREPRYVT
jgi:chorismate dehydratase